MLSTVGGGVVSCLEFGFLSKTWLTEHRKVAGVHKRRSRSLSAVKGSGGRHKGRTGTHEELAKLYPHSLKDSPYVGCDLALFLLTLQI